MSNHFEDPDERALSDALNRKADAVGETMSSFDAVRTRAGSVRRRRRLVAGAGLAAAAAILVPIAIVASDGQGDTDIDTIVATTTPSGDPTSRSTTAPLTTPTAPAKAPFDAAELPVGAPPAIDWADGRDIHRADGTIAEDALPPDTKQFSTWGSGWLAVIDDGSVKEDGTSGDRIVWPVPEGYAAATPVTLGEVVGDVTTSAGGGTAAWVKPDGTVQVLDADFQVVTLPSISSPDVSGAVAVTGEDCQETAANAPGCTVFVNTGIWPDAGVWLSTSRGFAERYDEGTVLMDTWTPGAYAVTTDVDELEPSACSAVRNPDTLSTVWETCDYRLLSFSPDGSHLLAVGSLIDNFGDRQVALLDASDGTVVAEVESTDPKDLTPAQQLVWEDDSHVLIVTATDRHYAVVRLGLDGSMEYAVPPRTAKDVDQPMLAS